MLGKEPRPGVDRKFGNLSEKLGKLYPFFSGGCTKIVDFRTLSLVRNRVVCHPATPRIWAFLCFYWIYRLGARLKCFQEVRGSTSRHGGVYYHRFIGGVRLPRDSCNLLIVF